MVVRRRSDRFRVRALFCLSVVSLCLFLVQHKILSSIEVLDQAYEVLPDFTSLNFGHQQDRSGSIDSEKNSTQPRQSEHSFHTCTILNRTVKVPIAPQFIIAGAQKCGTTALFEFLNEHPSIQGSVAIEPHFFDWHYPSNYQKEKWLGNRNLSLDIPESDFQCAVKQAYGENFVISPNAPAGTIFFEKTPSYLFLTKVPELIISTCSWKPKIIVILRNPVDRAFSHFRMKVRTHGRAFEDLIDDEIANFRSVGLSNAPLRTADYTQDDPGFQIPHLTKNASEEKHWKHYRKMFANNYLQRGMYITQLNHWIRSFPLGESLLVLNYERFKYQPTQIFSELLDFVGVPPFVPAEGFATEHNARGPPQHPMSNATRNYLSAFFRPYNNMLADVLGEDWRGVWD
jgi:hypothetical protein